MSSGTSESIAAIEASLLEGASIRRIIDLRLASADGKLIVVAKVDLRAELTMKEVSVVLHQAKRRVREAAPNVAHVYIEPDVWIDPEAAQPTTSTVVMLGLD